MNTLNILTIHGDDIKSISNIMENVLWNTMPRKSSLEGNKFKRMINTKTGTIELKGKSLIPSPNLKRDALLASDLFTDVIQEENFGDFHNDYLEVQELNDAKFMIKLFFNSHDCLNMLTLVREQENNQQNWHNWFEAEEQLKKQEHHQWLTKQIGPPPYPFPWGVIESAFEAQSGSSSIIIRYTNE